MKIRPVGAAFFHADGLPGRYGWIRRRYKSLFPILRTPLKSVDKFRHALHHLWLCDVRTGLRYAFRMKAGIQCVQQMPATKTTLQCTGRPHAPFPGSYPAAAGCSAARLFARPTSRTQVVTRLCNGDIAKNVSFSCYITGRKVKGKVRPACTTACNWRPTAGVRSKQLRAAGWGQFGKRRRGEQGPEFDFLLRSYLLRSVVIFVFFIILVVLWGY